MEKIIKINEQEIKLASNAATPMLYRKIYTADIFKDFVTLESQMQSGQISGEGIEIIQRVAHVTAYQADKGNVTLDPEDWLSQFELMDFIDVLPDIIEMWSGETETTSEAKKKNEKPSEE